MTRAGKVVVAEGDMVGALEMRVVTEAKVDGLFGDREARDDRLEYDCQGTRDVERVAHVESSILILPKIIKERLYCSFNPLSQTILVVSDPGQEKPHFEFDMSEDTLSLHNRCAVILTALPVEYSAVRSHVANAAEILHPEGTVYEKGDFLSVDGRTWSIVLAEVGAGNSMTAMEAERAISHFNPSVLLFVGVAGGLKDVNLCDVVAATKIYGYESGKAAERTFLPRPNVGESSYMLEQRARAEARNARWKNRLTESLEASSVQVHVGPIVSGEKVVASERAPIRKFLRQSYSDALAVEMEGRGGLHAARASRRVEALIIRGISDLLSGKKKADKNGYQQRAANNASAFAFEVLANLQATAPPRSFKEESGQFTLDIVDRLRNEDRVPLEVRLSIAAGTKIIVKLIRE
jgi:nucleoside phosphorylase